MTDLNIDIESFSSVDIKKCGSYKYIESYDFDILLLSYSFEGEPVQCVDLASGEEIPLRVIEALTDPFYIKKAYNAQFERLALQVYLTRNLICDGMTADDYGTIYDLPIEQWECTMVKAAMCGLPMGLGNVAKAMRLPIEKMTEGASLIRFFCIPCKPTKANGMRTRNYPKDDPEKWEKFKQYNITDVVVEKQIQDGLWFFSIPEREKEMYALDQLINDQGVALDLRLIENAINIDETHKEILTEEAIELTGLSNPNSVKQLCSWLTENTDQEISTLRKDQMPALIKGISDAKIKRVLKLRQEMSKTSVKKYKAMLNAICRDGRFHGMLLMYGASRTGRWAGRLVQVHNLPKNELKDLEDAREFVFKNWREEIELIWGNVPNILSQLVRTSFVPDDNEEFIVSDFAAIEAVVISWLAGEEWRMEIFRTHGKIYEASASQMFNVPIESITFIDENGREKEGPNYKLRASGKVSELALGFQGSIDALIRMGAIEKGVCDEAVEAGEIEVVQNAFDYITGKLAKRDFKTEKNGYAVIVSLWCHIEGTKATPLEDQNVFLEWSEEAKTYYQRKELLRLVRLWRKANYNIVKMWYAFRDAAVDAILNPGELIDSGYKGITFQVMYNILWITLPSGRKLAYWKPAVSKTEDENGKPCFSIAYEGLDQNTKQWSLQRTYGGKITENIVQAIARDCLRESLLNAHSAGYKIRLHVHDELVASVKPLCDLEEALKVDKEKDKLTEIMSSPISWAPGLPLKVKAYRTPFYKKD